MTDHKKPTDKDLDMEAACFLANAHEMAHRIRCGRIQSVTVSYSQKRRNTDAGYASNDTINMKVVVSRPTRDVDALTVEDAERMIDAHIKEHNQ